MLLYEINDKIEEDSVSLWCEVFGDEKEYAKLILPFLKDFKYFAHYIGDTLTSQLYLLPCAVKIEDEIFKGQYLYAAATKEAFRGKGYMGCLIEEAKEYAKKKGEFISLVPASESLYGYYGRFGFKECMFKYEISLNCNSAKLGKLERITDIEEITRRRLESSKCLHFYEEKSMEYAMSCYGFGNSYYYKLSDTCIFLYDGEENKVIEFLSSSEKTEENLKKLADILGGNVSLDLPFKINESRKEKCGMIYTENEQLLNTAIYNNLTLG